MTENKDPSAIDNTSSTEGTTKVGADAAPASNEAPQTTSSVSFTKIHNATGVPDSFFWTAYAISGAALVVALWCIASGRKFA